VSNLENKPYLNKRIINLSRNGFKPDQLIKRLIKVSTQLRDIIKYEVHVEF